MCSRPVYPGSTLLLEVDKNVHKFILKSQRRKATRVVKDARPRKSERVTGNLMPLWLPAKPERLDESNSKIGIFPERIIKDTKSERQSLKPRAKSALRQAFETMRIKDVQHSDVASDRVDIVAPTSSPRIQKPMSNNVSVNQNSLPLKPENCIFSTNYADITCVAPLIAAIKQDAGFGSPGQVAFSVAKNYNANVIDADDNPPSEDTVTELVDNSDRAANNSSPETIPRVPRADTSNRRKYSGIKRAVFLVDREPSNPRFRSQRPNTANLLLGVSGKNMYPIGRSPQEEDKAIRHLAQIENAIDSALRQLHHALYAKLESLFDFIGPVVRMRSLVHLYQPGLTTVELELDIPQPEQRKIDTPWRPLQRSDDLYHSQSYRRRIRPMTAATADPSGCGLQIVGTVAQTKPPSLPIPFCFSRMASSPSPNSNVQFLFIPDSLPLGDNPANAALDNYGLATADVVFKSWAILYGFKRVDKKSPVPVLEFAGEAGASVVGSLCVIPASAAIRFLATVRRIEQAHENKKVRFRGVAYLPVWTSLRNDPCLAENCLLSLVCFFDAEPAENDITRNDSE